MSITAAVVVGFVLALLVGNLLGAKPDEQQVALGHFRMQVRKVGLFVELDLAPSWVDYPKTLAQYTQIDDTWCHPKVCYVAKDGVWHQVSGIGALHGQAIALPKPIVAYVAALRVQSNGVCLFWRDEDFVKSGVDTAVLPALVQSLTNLGLVATQQTDAQRLHQSC